MTALERLQVPGVCVAFGGSQRAAQMPSSERVLLQFRVIANAVRLTARPARATHPVTDRKLLAPSAIAHSPGMSVNDLASALGVRQPTASQVAKALAQLRLVEVQRDRRDRRAVTIHVSNDGLAVLRRLPAHFDFGDRLPEALAQLDGAALLRLESGLTSLVRALPRAAALSDDRSDADISAGREQPGNALDC
jgi:MarR family transcriptional regulator, organic hydroperoxide resistance regulator